MTCKISAGSAKCSKASRETTRSASCRVEVAKAQVSWTPAASAFCLAGCKTFSRISIPITCLAPFAAISTASAPSPQPKSTITFPAILGKKPSPMRIASFDRPSQADRLQHEGSPGEIILRIRTWKLVNIACGGQRSVDSVSSGCLHHHRYPVARVSSSRRKPSARAG